jgi:hypothetical protein
MQWIFLDAGARGGIIRSHSDGVTGIACRGNAGLIRRSLLNLSRMWQLFGTLRNGESLKHDFHPDRMTIGRAPTNSIQLEDETVSCLHAEIERVGPGKFVLRDLGSKNGTFVDGTAVTEMEISNPCKIAFGALTFEVRIDGEAETAAKLEAKDSPSDEAAMVRAHGEKLRREFENERKELSEKIARIARENAEQLLEKRKECEGLSRTIEELKKAHGAELKSDRREHSGKIAKIEKQSEARVLEKQKECEALNRTIEELKGEHGAELENQRREHSGKIETFEKQSEARVVEKQKECEGLNRTIEELKGAHGAELEGQRREHSGKIETIEKQSEARVLEKQKECEGLNRTIEELKGAHGAELENQRREHSGKIETIEKQSEARVLEKQKECEGLNRTIEELKGAHDAELENQRREHSGKIEGIEKQCAARVIEKQQECEALNRTIEELKGAHRAQFENEQQAHRERIANVERESEASLRKKQEECEGLNRAMEELKRASSAQARAVDSSLSDKSSETSAKPEPAAAKPRFAWATLANRRGTDQWRRTFFWAGILCFGLCLLAQSLPSTVLPSITPQRIVSQRGRAAVPSAAQDAARETTDAGAVRQGEAPDSGSLQKVADNVLDVSSGDDLDEAAQADRHAPAADSGENSVAPSVGLELLPAIKPSAEKAATAGTNENPATPNPDEATKNAPSEEPPAPVTPTNSAEKGASRPESPEAPTKSVAQAVAADRGAQNANANGLRATGEPWEDDRLPEIAERPASESAGAPAPVPGSVDPGPADEAAQNQSAAAPTEPRRARALAIGFRLQEAKAAPESANSVSDRRDGGPNPAVTKRDDAAVSGAAEGKDAEKGSRNSLDQAKADSPSSISKALTHKDTPDTKTLKGPQPLRILILGDSLSLCGFGKRLDQKFRSDPQVQSVFTYMACGTHPLSWIKEKPYATVKTYCGFWSIESSAGQPKELEDTYGMKQGYVPKPHPVPKLEDLLEAVHPDILVMQCGTNLFSLFGSRTTVQPGKDGPMVRHYIAPFINAARKCPSLRKIYWVSPPTSGRSPVEIQDFVFNETRACADWIATVIDSRPLVSYPYHQMEPDHEHFMGTDMTQWADRIYAFVKQDLSSQPFSSLPVLAQLEPPVKGQAAVRKETEPTETPLCVRARLAFKSQPIPLKELMPYQESLVGFVYDVSQVVNGKYEDKQILVLHPSCIGLKPQPLDKYKMGTVYNLRLHEVETTPWHTVKCQDESGRIDLIPYIQVEDEKKFPGNSH